MFIFLLTESCKMKFLQCLFCACIFLLMGCHLAMAIAKNHALYKVPGKKSSKCEITVDQSGHGNFSSIQSAINAIPPNNNRWICISIKAGIYREKVKIPYDRPYIILKGHGKRRTRVIWDDHQSVAESPTFTCVADNIVVKKISFLVLLTHCQIIHLYNVTEFCQFYI